MQNLVLSQGSKLQVLQDPGQSKARFGAKSWGLFTDWGVIPVKQSVYIPAQYAFLISSKTWKLMSAGKFGILDDDGNAYLRDASTDSYTVRMGAIDVQLVCTAPGWNMTVLL
jgi:hypothetical protein